MSVPVRRRLAVACRLVLFIVVSILPVRPAAAARVAGRVVDPDGRPVASARVIVPGRTGIVGVRLAARR